MSRLSEIILCLCISLISLNGRAQVSYKEFSDQSDLNIKSEMGLELWNYYIRADLDSLKIAAVDLLLLASEKEHEFARAAGTRMLGSYLYRSGKIEQGLEYLNMARGFFEKREDFMVASEIYNEIGHANLLKGDYDGAKDAYNRSLGYGKLSTDDTDKYNGKLGLGRTYVAMGDTNAGMTILHAYKQRSLESKKYEAVSDVYAYMAMIESARGDTELSIEYYMESVNHSRKSNSKVHLGHSYANMGILKFQLAEYDSSLYYFQESLQLRQEVRAIRPIIEGYYNLGFFHLEMDSINRSIEYFEAGLDLAIEKKYYSDEIDLLKELIPIYESQGNQTLVKRYQDRVEELEMIIKSGSKEEDEELKQINLEFEGKKDASQPNGGIGWISFTLIAVALLLIVFFFLERKRFGIG